MREETEKTVSQCRKLLNAMLSGEGITAGIAGRKYGVFSLPRRIKDIKEGRGVPSYPVKSIRCYDQKDKRIHWNLYFIEGPL